METPCSTCLILHNSRKEPEGKDHFYYVTSSYCSWVFSIVSLHPNMVPVCGEVTTFQAVHVVVLCVRVWCLLMLSLKKYRWSFPRAIIWPLTITEPSFWTWCWQVWKVVFVLGAENKVSFSTLWLSKVTSCPFQLKVFTVVHSVEHSISNPFLQVLWALFMAKHTISYPREFISWMYPSTIKYFRRC